MKGADQKERFWTNLEELVSRSEIVIDRPKGSRHPRHAQMEYQVDYGYLAGTSSADGEGIDIWLGSDPGRKLDAIICTVDLGKGDAEIKLLVGCTQDEIAFIESFHNMWPQMGGILVRREG